MNLELEEQQKLACELKERLQSMEKEERELNEKVRILETKLVVHDLRNKVKVKNEALNQLRSKVGELEEKLKTKEVPVVEHIQSPPLQEEKPRQFF
jgi:hypothetical protein